MMAWIEVDYKMPEFLKTDQDELFANIQVGLKKTLNICKKCCNKKFLKEIAFYHLIRVFLSCYSTN